MLASVHYADNVHNVKTNRGGITGHIYCISHFLACTIIIHSNNCYSFMQFSLIVYYICVFYCIYYNCIFLHANKVFIYQLVTQITVFFWIQCSLKFNECKTTQPLYVLIILGVFFLGGGAVLHGHFLLTLIILNINDAYYLFVQWHVLSHCCSFV